MTVTTIRHTAWLEPTSAPETADRIADLVRLARGRWALMVDAMVAAGAAVRPSDSEPPQVMSPEALAVA